MSAGDGAGLSTLADAASTTLASDNPNTRAVIRAMSTRDTLSGPPMLNVLFLFDRRRVRPPRRGGQRDDVRGDVDRGDGAPPLVAEKRDGFVAAERAEDEIQK